MIIRIVKLQFQPEKMGAFLSFFEEIKQDVNNFPGCLGMRLVKEVGNSGVILTYSHWESEQDLENYRVSGKFGEIWPTIKPWFAGKAEAWTTEMVFDGFTEKNS